MNDDDEAVKLRRRLGGILRDLRRFLRGEAEEPPSPETVCLWLELAYVFECWDDVLALWERIFETDTDRFLYGRARQLVRTARQKVTQRDAEQPVGG